ncbi:MAG: nuclear transport factor 2 family protein [Acidobacteria bacterium]|nr:nuclear transport factor 2 family protein [Acidobacteriota bacterium]
MPIGLHPVPAPESGVGLDSPQSVVEAFLAALAAKDAETADALIDDDIEYVNVSLPAVRGRSEFGRVLALLSRPGTGFEVYLHSIAAEGSTVLTERTDVVVIGSVRIQFWVWGRFEVRDGAITLWRDSFDFVDIARATVRGLIGVALPSLRPVSPSDTKAAPGR